MSNFGNSSHLNSNSESRISSSTPGSVRKYSSTPLNSRRVAASSPEGEHNELSGHSVYSTSDRQGYSGSISGVGSSNGEKGGSSSEDDDEENGRRSSRGDAKSKFSGLKNDGGVNSSGNSVGTTTTPEITSYAIHAASDSDEVRNALLCSVLLCCIVFLFLSHGVPQFV